MDCEFDYRLTELAESDLDEIAAYIANTLCNRTAAISFLEIFQKKVEEIRLFPESGAPVENELVSFAEVRKKNVGNYILYYIPDMENRIVYILRIIYGRRNLQEILQTLNIR